MTENEILHSTDHSSPKHDEGKSVAQKMLDDIASIPSDYIHAWTKRPLTTALETIYDPLLPLFHEKLVKEPPRRMHRQLEK